MSHFECCYQRFWRSKKVVQAVQIEIKCFVTHIMENPPRHLLGIVFWLCMGPNGQKMPIFGPK